MLSNKKIKIVHIINNLEVGGAEKILVLLLNKLSKREDLEIYIISLEGHGVLANDLPKNVHLKEFKYKLFTPRFLNKIKPDFRFGLLFYILKIKPDVIHGHLFKGEDFAKVLGFLTRIPVVTTAHDVLIYPGLKSKFLNRYVKKAVAVSKVVADHLKSVYGYSDNKIEIIPNAIEIELFEKGRKVFDIKKPVFLYIGRLLESKGIEDAIRGLAKLKDEYPNMEFLIYGKEVFESYKNHLKQIVNDNNWDFVEFMGRTDDVPAALGMGDILILPSKSEGFAISVLEAAAAKKPIVATRVGIIPEIIKDGISGMLVDYHNPDQIYKACKKILDEGLVEKFGNEARVLAEKKYDIKKVTEMYIDLYKKVL